MAFGTWRSPFPLQFGPRSTRRIDKIYQTIRTNIGTALSDSETSATVADDIAAARCLSIASRANDRRICQGQDPRTLTEPLLSRWEAILGIQAPSTDSDYIRRNRVASRLLTNATGQSGSLQTAADTAFSPWSTVVHYNSLATAVMSWPGGSPSAPNDWYSTIANIAIEYIRPVGATDEQAEERRDACRSAFDEYLPAWCTFRFHETPSGYDFHWIADVTRCDIGVVGDP
jgi:uncharacterized protein YmfQ (DUF2313 family)